MAKIIDPRKRIDVVKLLAYLQSVALQGRARKNAAIRITACRILLNKVLPDLTSIEGVPDRPVVIDTAPGADLEVARRFAFLLAKAARQPKEKA